MNLANEGLEAKKKEDEVLAKKRKAEDDAHWEGSWLQISVLSSADLPDLYNSEPRATCRQLADI